MTKKTGDLNKVNFTGENRAVLERLTALLILHRLIITLQLFHCCFSKQKIFLTSKIKCVYSLIQGHIMWKFLKIRTLHYDAFST